MKQICLKGKFILRANIKAFADTSKCGVNLFRRFLNKEEIVSCLT